MGFFKDFKRDFAQAVNELMPDKAETSGEYDDEDMVNTFDESDNMEIAPEDMEDGEINTFDDESNNELMSEMTADDTSPAPAEDINNSSEDSDEELAGETSDDEGVPKDSGEDEITSLDGLDESDMLEGTEDAEKIDEPSDELEDLDGIVGKKVNISKDVSDAMAMREEDVDEAKEDEGASRENEDWEGSMAEIEQVRDEEMKETNIESIMTDDTTYISKGTTVDGGISTEGSIDIIGTVNGDVSCAGKLILGGTISGNVLVGELYANAAKIDGDVVSEGSAKIGVGSVIVGNITATSAVIAGAIKGDIDVKGPVIVDSTAVIMGNIKSRSVQINNGAVIEGLCSQCYAEIDVKSFFE